MQQPTPTRRAYLFGMYSADLRSGELHKNGITIKLGHQPFQILVILLEHAAGVVTREELRQVLWPSDTFVDFDHSLNSAINKLREALNDSAEHPRYIETLPRRGYRFIAPVRELDAAPATALETTAPEIEVASEARVRVPRVWAMWIATACVVGALLAAGYFAWRRSSPPPEAPRGFTRIAVLPFANLSGQKEQEYLSDGLAEEMIAQLGPLYPQGLGAIAWTSAIRYKDPHKPLDQVGRDLGADYILEGSVRAMRPNRVRVIAQLIRARDQTQIWAKSYEGDLNDILTWQGEVAGAIAEEIRLTLPSSRQQRLATARAANPEAFQLYLRGRHFTEKWTEAGLKKGLGYLQQAIEKDPSYAPPYATLVYWHFSASGLLMPASEANAQAKALARKAVEVDPNSAEAHAALAIVACFLDWDFLTAERELRRAIELNPGDANSHRLLFALLWETKRPTEAREALERAFALDPLSVKVATSLAFHSCVELHRCDEAIRLLEKTIEINPDSWLAHTVLGRTYEQKRMYDEAIAEHQIAVALAQRQVDVVSSLANAYAVAGKRKDAEALLQELLERARKELVPSNELARVYAALGDTDRAFAWLEKAYVERDPLFATITIDPDFASLRSDPRYAALCRRVGLPP